MAEGNRLDVDGLTQAALQRGISSETVARCLPHLRLVEEIHACWANQPESVLPPPSYLERCVTEQRISDGRVKLDEHADLTRKFSGLGLEVGPEILMAIWGLETSYGAVLGDFHVIQALSTLSCSDTGRRQFFVENLLAALEIVQRGMAPVDCLLGSWAGAMGHTQFMPASFLRYGVSLTHNVPDIWGSDPSDALASTANFLLAAGWKAAHPVLSEVLLPPGFPHSEHADRASRTVAEWQHADVVFLDVEAEKLSDQVARLLLPAGANGPALATFSNFEVIGCYNRSLNYQLAVLLLSRGLSGRSGFQVSWPDPHLFLARHQIMELQKRLHCEGFDTGGIDGIAGPATRAAIRCIQAETGRVADGFPDRDLLAWLRQRQCAESADGGN